MSAHVSRVLTFAELVAWHYTQIRRRDELMLPEAVRSRARTAALQMVANNEAVEVSEVDGTTCYRVIALDP